LNDALDSASRHEPGHGSDISDAALKYMCVAAAQISTKRRPGWKTSPAHPHLDLIGMLLIATCNGNLQCIIPSGGATRRPRPAADRHRILVTTRRAAVSCRRVDQELASSCFGFNVCPRAAQVTAPPQESWQHSVSRHFAVMVQSRGRPSGRGSMDVEVQLKKKGWGTSKTPYSIFFWHPKPLWAEKRTKSEKGKGKRKKEVPGSFLVPGSWFLVPGFFP